MILNIFLFIFYIAIHAAVFAMCASAAHADRIIERFPRN